MFNQIFYYFQVFVVSAGEMKCCVAKFVFGVYIHFFQSYYVFDYLQVVIVLCCLFKIFFFFPFFFFKTFFFFFTICKTVFKLTLTKVGSAELFFFDYLLFFVYFNFYFNFLFILIFFIYFLFLLLIFF